MPRFRVDPVANRCASLSSWLLIVVALTAICASSGSASDESVGSGLSAISRLDTLARFSAAVEVGSVSSYDRTGGNDDGFSGKYSCLRKEAWRPGDCGSQGARRHLSDMDSHTH